jgi:hypothetical protein
MFRARPAGDASAVDADNARPPRRSRREARGARHTVGVLGRSANLLARIIRLVVSVVVLIIIAGILLVVLKANPANGVASEVHSWAHWLAGPFDGMFSFRHPRVALAVNWAIAAVVYLLVGALIVRMISGAQRGQTKPERSQP